MKKILFVEDDALIARIYTQKLAQAGFEVARAEDGLAAMKCLPEFKPDLVVLDLLMPKLNGVDVLKFVRERPELRSTRVVVFSNAFLHDLAEQVRAIGVEEVLAKSTATPALLVETIHKVLGRSRPTGAAPNQAGAPSAEAAESAPSFRMRVNREFFERIPVIAKGIRDARREFLEAAGPVAESQQLEALSRKIGFLTHMTGMAGCSRIAQLCSALEALLFALQDKPDALNDSTRHTIASTTEFLADCLDGAHQADEPSLSPPTALVVDDDAVTNRAIALALGRVNLAVTSRLDSLQALDTLQQNPYDVVLLDLNLPGMDGISLCERMRRLPQHKRTPVIFITSYADFAARARSILAEGDDLIAKPILPVELSVKVIAHMLKRWLAGQTPTP